MSRQSGGSPILGTVPVGVCWVPGGRLAAAETSGGYHRLPFVAGGVTGHWVAIGDYSCGDAEAVSIVSIVETAGA
jgi:hypothetical protein